MKDTDLIAFNNERYFREQTSAILEKVGRFNDKLYLEFGITYDVDALKTNAICTMNTRRESGTDYEY